MQGTSTGSISPSCSSAASSSLKTCTLRCQVSTTASPGVPTFLRAVDCTWTMPRFGRLRDGRTPSTRVSASIVSPTYTGAPKRMSMYSRLVRAFSETSSTVWLNATSMTSPGGHTRSSKP